MNNRIRELRERRHMTQTRLSIELEVSQETVSAYESGRHYPSYQVLVKLSDLFGVSIDYLMGRENKSERWDELSEEERTLLTHYRSLNALRRAKAEAYIQGLCDRDPKN